MPWLPALDRMTLPQLNINIYICIHIYNTIKYIYICNIYILIMMILTVIPIIFLLEEPWHVMEKT